jgi:magnesium-dependent phosphatase 1
MLFFDDEARNRNVEELGVTFVDAEGGLTQEMVKAGLREYERRHIN